MNYERVEAAIEACRQGQFIVVTDDYDRENEGDLIMPAEKVTPEAIAFMVRHTSGLICMGMEEQRLNELEIPLMVAQNTESHKTAFTHSVDYLPATTTGISAADRAATVQALIDPTTKGSDFSRPGHLFPLRYREGGVLKRAGHTEAAVDFARLSDCTPAGILCELVNDDGTMMRQKELNQFAEQHSLVVVSIADLIRYRRSHEKVVRRVSSAQLPTDHGTFLATVYESELDGIQHFALVKGEIAPGEPTLVRVHSECLTGDIFRSRRCDCGEQLTSAMDLIEKEGKGVVIYLRGHEGRGIGLGHKLRAYNLQDQGRDTVEANEELGFPADSREYGIGAQILADLGVQKIKLLTNNPAKYGGIEGFDLQVVERVPLLCTPTAENRDYLTTKQEKLGHLLNLATAEK